MLRLLTVESKDATYSLWIRRFKAQGLGLLKDSGLGSMKDLGGKFSQGVLTCFDKLS